MIEQDEVWKTGLMYELRWGSYYGNILSLALVISLQKKCISATHICNAFCVADFAMQKTGLQIFCNASQRCVAVICNALVVADKEVMPTLWWNTATQTALRNLSATNQIALQNISASDVHKQ